MNEEDKWIRSIQRKADNEAANKIITKYYKEIYSYIYQQTINKELSLDLTQEVFIRMLKSMHHYDSKKASFRTWLHKIATYQIVDYYRSKNYKYRTDVSPIEDFEIIDYEDFILSLEYKEDIEKINEIVKYFNSTNQQIIRLKLFADYSFVEISKLLKITESTVKTKYYSTLKIVRKELKEWCK
ncbi:RNA polymerase sigma factor [Bacillus alkalicellulosilyticus]|uniref:RNA polymerase sigma factor n=1 Tax=Alkalihalobacterium alkalicellulosilyticum TaxID=1912214 RepID=UPI00099871FC|nr:sigma-70 family RNA polymerase sigma factor [Bacillus alkalicellulosilyticus]